MFTYPRVLGHELAVTVETVPAGDTRVRVGDLCAVRPFLNDPLSRASLRGRPNCCESLKVLGVHIDGGMGELLAIETRFLHPVPDLDIEAAALIEPLSIGCHAVGRGRPTPEDRTLVIGAGPIGLATAQFAALAGAPLTIVDLSERRRATAPAIVPAAAVVDAVPADDALRLRLRRDRQRRVDDARLRLRRRRRPARLRRPHARAAHDQRRRAAPPRDHACWPAATRPRPTSSASSPRCAAATSIRGLDHPSAEPGVAA